MFEGAIAAFLNRLLGRYIEDLDTERFNVGIFSGDTCLTDLKLKPEALYQVGLPIRVEVGSIGKIVLKIPWSGLFSQPIVLCVEDVYIVAVPTMSGPYDAEVQKRLTRAEKRKILEDLKEDELCRAGLSSELFDGLLASITKNFQIAISNVHIRYEEKISSYSMCACGICIQSISVTTTNNKWKPGVCSTNSQTIYQLIRAESLSMYLDNEAETSLTSPPSTWDTASFFTWKAIMHRGLQTFGMKNEEFQFLLKPFTAKVKMIVHKGNEAQPSRMLVDIVLQDVAMQVSQAQYITFCHIYDSLLRAVINRPFRKHRPDKTIKEEPGSWWRYAYHSVVDYHFKPYTWPSIIEHRKNYREYKETYIQNLLRPNDAELKLDLQKYEDRLTILNIVIAREHAKQELTNKNIERNHRNASASRSESSDKTGVSEKDWNWESEGGTRRKLYRYSNNDRIVDVEDDNGDENEEDICEDDEEDDNGNDNHNSHESSTRGKIEFEKLAKPIDYKINFTLANCCLSLLKKNKEVLVITFTQFLMSIEARPTISAFKISARAESFVIEGVSPEGDLVPLVTVDNVLTGNIATNFLAIDFEKNGINVDPIFDISIKLEAIEVTYHFHAVMEIVKFFQCPDGYAGDTVMWLYKFYENIKRKLLSLVDVVVSQTLRIGFKIDIKGPYIVFPEYGSIQKGGHVLVVDVGNITVTNELQAINLQLEDATLMELEELLYDRIHVDFSEAQILLCHSGDDWRSTRRRKDSEYHFVPKIQANATLSYSIKPEYRQLPRMKLNVSVSSVKFNLSESKLWSMLHFLNLLSAMYRNSIEKYKGTFERTAFKEKLTTGGFVSVVELGRVRSAVCLPAVTISRGKFTHLTKELVANGVPKLDRSVVSSEVSEEDLELLSKTINLSSFDDNASPCNHINLLFRFAVGELSVHFGCADENGREQPYLTLRLNTLYLETAVLEYGFAVQFGVGSVLLVDKTNVDITGSYLELISTGESDEVLVVSYRKVKSNCPDFKSHFKSIERSLLVNLLNINVTLHRTAFLKIRNYWNELNELSHGNALVDLVDRVQKILKNITGKENDPPIPPGAIKLNYSARLGALVLRLCDKDTELAEIKLSGLENDCIYNANERMVLRAHLRSAFIEDPNDDTLYSKILTTDEDKVFDLKYVRHTPRLYVCQDIDSNQDDVMSDGTFKLSVGRINCVIISKILQDIRHFFTPFASSYCTRFVEYSRSKCLEAIQDFKRSGTKLHIFIDIQGPTLLLPQKKDAPNLLILDTGVLSVENFFKTMTLNEEEQTKCVIDNILLKLKSLTVSRAIMTLSRDLETQEPIIEPIQIHCDAKRKTEYRNAMEFQTYGLFSVQGSIDFFHINTSQRDLKSMVSVWKDNISLLFPCRKIYEEPSSIGSCSEKINRDEAMVRKLEDFLAHDETASSNNGLNIKLTFEGLQLNLFLDSEEVLSSPVRDLNHGLCELSFGEMTSVFQLYSDKNLQVKLSLQSCLLRDTRKNSSVVKKIIRSLAHTPEASGSPIPVLDVTYKKAPSGETHLDVLIQETRINLYVPFLIQLARYVMDSLPGEQLEKGIINRGFESNDLFFESRNVSSAETDRLNRDQYFKEQPDSYVTVKIRKPEVLLLGDSKGSNMHVVLIEADVVVESKRHECSSAIVCTLTNVRAKARSQENYLCQRSYWLMRPCDIEICRNEDLSGFACGTSVEVSLNVNSTMCFHVSAGIVHSFVEMTNEVTNFLSSFTYRETGYRRDSHDFSYGNVNLWTPKKVSNVPYKRIEDGDLDLHLVYIDRVTNFNLKPTSICLSIETESSTDRLSLIKVEATIEMTANDSYNDFQLESCLKIHAFCYNACFNGWEPLIELCTRDDVNYKPWELRIQVYHGDSYLIEANWTDRYQRVKEESLAKAKRKDLRNDERDSNTDMVFISPDRVNLSKFDETNLYSEYERDSDEDDENSDEDEEEDDEESQKKLTKTFNYLFDEGNSENEESDSDDSSANEDEGLELTPECNVTETFSPPHVRAPMKMGQSATYVVAFAEDKIDFTITPNTIAIINAIIDAFLRAKNGIPFVPASSEKLVLRNDIGHASKVELLITNGDTKTRVIAEEDYRDVESPTSLSGHSSLEADFGPGPNDSQWLDDEKAFVEPEDNLKDKDISLAPNKLNEDSVVGIYNKITEEVLRITVEGFEDTLIYCPKKQTRSLIPLRPVKHEVRYFLVVEAMVDNVHPRRTITVRSPLQIRNETSYALGLYYKRSSIEKLGLTDIGELTNPFDDKVRLAIVEPDSTYSVPLYMAYHFPIHLLPSTYLEKYQISEEGIYWKDLNEMAMDIRCKPKSEETRALFAVKASRTEIALESVMWNGVQPGYRVPNYLITIVPPLVFDNRLPFVIDVNVSSIDYEVKIEPGEKINVHFVSSNSDLRFIVKIQNYLGAHWTGTVKLNANSERKFIMMSTESESDSGKPFPLSVELCKLKTWTVIFQSRYWMINKSGLPLFMQDCHSHMVYEMPEEELTILSQRYNKKNLIRIKAHQSEWSAPFGLDGITSTSLIVCKDIERGRKYRILTEIESSRLSPLFTKILTFLPYLFVENKTRKALRFMEENDQADLWNDLLPGQEVPFWPATESMKMRVKWKNSQLVSQRFDITWIGRTVLRMDNGSALCVEIEGGIDTPYRVSFRKHIPGDIPVRVDNLCDDLFLKINQIDTGQATLLNPYQSLLYTWDDPTKVRALIWNVYNSKKTGYKALFETDGYGQERVSFVTVNSYNSSKSLVNVKSWSRDDTENDTEDSERDNKIKLESNRKEQKDKATVYWVSYKEGEQRVLLFTQHENLFSKARSIIDPEPSKRETFVSLAGIGLSVIQPGTNGYSKELMYTSISDSAAHWELYFGKSWKSLSLELSAWVEEKYMNFSKRALLQNFIDVDLVKMHMTKPFFGKLRRTYSPGIWLHRRESATLTYLEGHIHRIQIDNQLPDATFPVVLNCALQKSLVDYAGNRRLKHCIEFAVLKEEKPRGDVYKGISLLIREFHLNLEEEFLHSLMEMIPSRPETKHSIAAKLRKDVYHTFPLNRSDSDNKSVCERKGSTIERVYISPILIRLKLLANTEGSNLYNFSELADYRNTVRSIFEYAEKGVLEKHAEFKLPYYRKDSAKNECGRFFMELMRGYTIQVMQQFHVLIRSITVLGNQYGYNFKLPGDRFYDPNSLTMYVDEVSEKLYHEVAYQIGYITTPMSATLTTEVDTDRRRNFPTRRSSLGDSETNDVNPEESSCCYFENKDVPPAVFSIDDFFSTEIELETSGLVTTSISSIHREEFKYSFKILGKKTSIFFKLDRSPLKTCTKLTADIVRRAQETGHGPVSRIRLPRYVNPRGVVELFSTHKAKGMHLLSTVNKTDTYWAHTMLSGDGRYIALVSLQRVYLIEKGRTWGSWNVKWSLETIQLSTPPTVSDDRLILYVNKNEEEPKSCTSDWYLESKESDILEWLRRKINIAMILNLENSVCSKQYL